MNMQDVWRLGHYSISEFLLSDTGICWHMSWPIHRSPKTLLYAFHFVFVDRPSIRPAGVFWGPRPCLAFSAAPGCGSDEWHCRQSPPPPWHRGCPRRAGSQWLSSQPCPGHRGNHQRSCGNGQRRRPSLLCRRGTDRRKVIRMLNETTWILVLNVRTKKLEFVIW